MRSTQIDLKKKKRSKKKKEKKKKMKKKRKKINRSFDETNPALIYLLLTN